MSKNKNTIFVQLPSYRDAECQWTVKDLFEKAKYPENVFIGICWQLDDEEDKHCFVEPYKYPKQVREIKFHWKEGRGVCWARHHTQSLWKGEKYTLQIDAHSRMAQDWDVKMIKMLESCPSERCILSAYPAAYELPDKLITYISKTASNEFTSDDYPQAKGIRMEMDAAPEKPILGSFVSGGFIFGKSEIITEVPYDPHIYFWGEEPTMSARYWTNGWDIYHPNDCLVYHLYFTKENPSKRVHHWSDHKEDWAEIDRNSKERVRHILGTIVSQNSAALKEIEKYGIGKKRSIEQFYEHSGVNFREKTLTEDAKHARYPSRPDSAINPHYKKLAPTQNKGLALSLKLPGGFNSMKTARHGIFVYNHNDAYIGKAIEKYGEWSEGQLKLLAQFCEPGDTIIECGANIGAHTIPLARLVGNGGRVFAFEAQRVVFQTLCANLALNSISNVECFHNAVYNKNMPLFYDVKNYNNRDNFGVLALKEQSPGEKVDSVHLDYFFKLPKLKLIKANINGNELKMLEGAVETIKKHRPFIYIADEKGEENSKQIETLLKPLDYVKHRHSSQIFSADNLEGIKEDEFKGAGSVHALWMPKEKSDKVELNSA